MAKKKATSKKPTVKVVSKEVKPAKNAEASVKIIKKEKSNSKVNFEAFLRPSVLAALAAEFFGTFLLASVVISGSGQPIIVLFGLMAIVLTFGAVSGAHVNPLITMGAWATRKISTMKALGYIAAQLLGSMLAFVVLKAFVDNAPEVSQEAAMYGQQAAELFSAAPIPKGKEILVLLAELMGATIFGFAVARATSEKSLNSTGVALGVSGGLFMAILIANSAAAVVKGGAILNPAIAVALQAFTVKDTNLAWAIATYVGAALIGGIIGFFLNSLIEKSEK